MLGMGRLIMMLVVRPLNSFACKVIEFMLTTSPELVFHSAGVKRLIVRRTSSSWLRLASINREIPRERSALHSRRHRLDTARPH
jgi:hypothetical protein